MEEILEKIKNFADNAHGDQVRRFSGKRYIVHPWSVMNLCKEYSSDISLLAAAILHDVLEDTPVSESDIYNFLIEQLSRSESHKAVNLVKELTDVFTRENCPQLNRKQRKIKEIERLSKISGDAQTVKYADLLDNCVDIASNDVDFAKVFLKESLALLLKINRGHPLLYRRTLKTIRNLIETGGT